MKTRSDIIDFFIYATGVYTDMFGIDYSEQNRWISLLAFAKGSLPGQNIWIDGIRFEIVDVVNTNESYEDDKRVIFQIHQGDYSETYFSIEGDSDSWDWGEACMETHPNCIKLMKLVPKVINVWESYD